jgi:histone deacetylase complex regulatory component SIN3
MLLHRSCTPRLPLQCVLPVASCQHCPHLSASHIPCRCRHHLQALEAIHAEMEAAGEPGSEERAAFRLDESSLSQLQWRAIKRLYGESGNQLTELLKKNPQVAVPVVLARLEQKDKEW